MASMDDHAFEPEPEAMSLAKDMAQADETIRTILDETVDSAAEGRILESGRTTCGSNRSIYGPIERFPSSVELKECPIGLSGAWHSHVTPRELRDPQLSLPDMANVVFGNLDVMGVVGTETAEYLVVADDREQMVQEFQNALGIEAESVDDVVRLIGRGRVQNPAGLRQRVRRSFEPLILTEETGFDTLTETVSQAEEAAGAPTTVAAHPDQHLYGMGNEEPAHEPNDASQSTLISHNNHLRNQARSIASVIRASSTDEDGDDEGDDKLNLKVLVLSNVVGAVVGSVVNRVLFSD